MPYIMKENKKRFYLKTIETDFNLIKRKAIEIRKRTGARYKIIRKGLFGGYELWVSKKGFY